MKAFSILLVAVTFEVATSTSIRGAGMQFQLRERDEESNHHRHRHLLQESTCTLFKRNAQYGPTEDHPDGYDTESWACELSEKDSTRLDVKFVEIVDSPAVTAAIVNATSGGSTLTMSEALVDKYEPRMIIPGDALVEVRNSSKGSAIGSLKRPSTTGTLKTLVIRLSDRNNVAPNDSIDQLKNDIFDDAVCLKSQMDACSYGKLKIEPFKGKTPNNQNINNGIVDVKMDIDINSGDISDDRLDSEAHKAAKKLLGNLEDSMFDLVMFCFPKKNGSNTIAKAELNGRFSYFYNDRCGDVTAQMHEIGHNLGLGHSGQAGEHEYGDGTGYMGHVGFEDDLRLCYNPQKSYQLGWYADKVETINPVNSNGPAIREFVLNGVSDYDSNNDALVVLRLEQKSMKEDYYVGFNRAQGINRDTTEEANMVTIVRKGKSGFSNRVATLQKPGKSHVIENFNGGSDVQILFIGLQNGNARIVVRNNNKPIIPQPKGNCKRFDIKVNTDEHPDDTAWFIIDKQKGEAVASSPLYTKSNKGHLDEVCLPMGTTSKTYKFIILDKYGDGLSENGSYKAYNEEGQTIFSGGGKFSAKDNLIEVPEDKDAKLPPPTNDCENEQIGRFKLKNGGRKRACKAHANRNKCNKKASNGKFVWQVCQNSCDKCNELAT